MYNCVIVKINNRPVAIFQNMTDADNFKRTWIEKYSHLNPVIYYDWAFIEGLPF